MRTEVRSGASQPDQVDRNEIYIQHDPDSLKVLGVWVGNKGDHRKVAVAHAVLHGADGADVDLKAETRYAGLDTSTAIATATLPSTDDIEDGHIATVKDEGGNAGTNNITVATPGAETVGGSATGTIATNGATQDYLWDEANTNWIAL